MERYRPNVAILVTDGHGRILLCYRKQTTPGVTNPVQTVQGGIDPGETPLQAAMREVHEEIGLTPEMFQVIGESQAKYRYAWPNEFVTQLGSATYIGQEQQFFLFQVDPETPFSLDHHHQEFESVRWGSPQELVDLAWEKKRPGLSGALKEFGLLPADS
jgi:putative (di)nucleoside polyphosphate hydrolase